MASNESGTQDVSTVSTGDITLDPAERNIKTPSKRDQTYDERTHQLRSLLQFFFFSAFKWKSGHCNFHLVQLLFLIIQLAKVVLITELIFSFGQDRRHFSTLVNKGSNTLRHLLLKGWDATMEVPPYPPSQGEFAVYNINDLAGRINFAVVGIARLPKGKVLPQNRILIYHVYYNAKEEAIGYYVRQPGDKLTINLKYFFFQGFDGPNNALDIRVVSFEPDYGLSLTNLTDGSTVYKYDIRNELESRNLTQPFKRLLDLQIHFQLHSVRIYEQKHQARCLRIQGTIRFEDLDNNGQVTLDLDTLTHGISCSEMNINLNDWVFERTPEERAWSVFVLSLVSILLSIGGIVLSFYTAVKTYRYMKMYFRRFYAPTEVGETNLSKGEYFRFVKLWDYCQLASDLMTITESYFIATQIKVTEWALVTLDSHSVWLSVGGLLAWLSLLRFFKFHVKFHLLFSTIYKAAIDIFAYLVCVTVLFVGFWVCGYVVLSPYHVKFETPSACAETLLSIVNGDEIYATLAMLEYNKSDSNVIWWFSRLYIFTYVAVFTVVVINLLIAIFTSAYDSIRTYNRNRNKPLDSKEKKPRTLPAFIEDCSVDGGASWTVGRCKFYHWLPINDCMNSDE